MDVKEGELLAAHTTFAIGGPARFYIEVRTHDEVARALAWAKERGCPAVIIGGGSNMLVPDEGLSACVIHIANKGMRSDDSQTNVTCAAGESLLALVQFCAAQGLGGIQKLAGIPGTVGGAVRGNAGAFGTEIKDVLVSTTALDVHTGEVKIFSKEECAFEYRSSYFKQHPNLIVVEAQFALVPGTAQELVAAIQNTIAERELRHIQDIKSAGSFFKNPVVSAQLQELFKTDKGAESKGARVPAGWLMDKAGLRGARVGDAVASEYHTNYFLNSGAATAAQVKELAQLAKEKVFKEFGVKLEEEAVVL